MAEGAKSPAQGILLAASAAILLVTGCAGRPQPAGPPGVPRAGKWGICVLDLSTHDPRLVSGASGRPAPRVGSSPGDQ